MTPELRDRLASVLERSHRLGMIGGDLDRQLDHCQAFLAALDGVIAPPADTTSGRGGTERWGVDLGTGGGIPGLVLAAARPDLGWVLVDSRTSRAAEVERCVARLGLEGVEVVAEPAQELAHSERWRSRFSVAVARSFGPPSFAAECASGFLEPNGSFLVSEPPTQEAERWSTSGLAACGFGEPQWVEYEGSRFAHIVRTGSTSPDLPRLPPRSDRGWPTP